MIRCHLGEADTRRQQAQARALQEARDRAALERVARERAYLDERARLAALERDRASYNAREASFYDALVECQRAGYRREMELQQRIDDLMSRCYAPPPQAPPLPPAELPPEGSFGFDGYYRY
jgi:hypothetical protein